MLAHCGFSSDWQTITNFCHGMWQSGEFRAANRGRIGHSNLRKEAVAATSNGFHKARTLGGVAEGLTDFADRFVETVVEIHEGVRGPEFLLKLFPSHDLTGVLKHHRQELEGLFLKPYSQSVLAQFARAKIQLENPKTEPPANVIVFSRQRIEPQSKASVPPHQGFLKL
jgi:hypothetical protein